MRLRAGSGRPAFPGALTRDRVFLAGLSFSAVFFSVPRKMGAAIREFTSLQKCRASTLGVCACFHTPRCLERESTEALQLAAFILSTVGRLSNNVLLDAPLLPWCW